MKKILTFIVLAAAVLTACDKQPQPSSDGVGSLKLTVTSSDALTVKSAEGVDINNFTLTISSTSVTNFKPVTYTVEEYNEAYPDGIMYLETGDFTVTVASPDGADAAWEQPLYGGSKDFTIKEDETTSVEVVCTIQNMKVCIETTDTFDALFENCNVVVSGEYDGVPESLTWTEAEIAEGKAGYFKVSDLTVNIKAYRKNSGNEVTTEVTITDCDPADYHLITVGVSGTGSAGFDIYIDEGTNEKNEIIEIPGFDDEEDVDTEAPTITWESNPDFEPVALASEMDVELVVDAPGGIDGFVVGISSPTLTSLMLKLMGLSTTMDLINDESAISVLGGLGLPVGEDLYGKTSVDFQLSSLLAMLYKLNPAAGTEHVFTLTVTDAAGQTAEQTLTFFMPEAEEDTTPTITWEANPTFESEYLASEMDVELLINAPEGIEEFVVGINSSITSNFLFKMMGLSDSMDLINGKSSMLTVLSGLGIPVGDDLYGQTSVDFSLSSLIPLLYTFNPDAGSEHIFTLTVTDAAGQTVEQSLTFVMPEAEEDTAPTITWEANPTFDDTYLAEEMDVDLVVKAPEGIATFTVDITSATLTPLLPTLGITVPLDIINDSGATGLLGTLGVTCGEDLLGATEVDFDISTLVPMIYALNPAAGSEHTFTIKVTDSKDQSVEQSLTFVMPGAETED